MKEKRNRVQRFPPDKSRWIHVKPEKQGTRTDENNTGINLRGYRFSCEKLASDKEVDHIGVSNRK